jgi:hypothetical protein
MVFILARKIARTFTAHDFQGLPGASPEQIIE